MLESEIKTLDKRVDTLLDQHSERQSTFDHQLRQKDKEHEETK